MADAAVVSANISSPASPSASGLGSNPSSSSGTSPIGELTSVGATPIQLLSTGSANSGGPSAWRDALKNETSAGSLSKLSRPESPQMTAARVERDRHVQELNDEAPKVRAESFKRINDNPNLSPEVRSAALTNPALRAFLGDEKISAEILENAEKNPQMRAFVKDEKIPYESFLANDHDPRFRELVYGKPSPVNSIYEGPVSMVKRNALPNLEMAQRYRAPGSYPDDISYDKGPVGVGTRGYNALDPDQRPLLGIDPGKLKASEAKAWPALAAETQFVRDLNAGVPLTQATENKQKSIQSGTAPFEPKPLQRQPGEPLGLYDRALYARNTENVINGGAFKGENLDGQVQIPTTYENENDVRSGIKRSLQYLQADPKLIESTKTAPLDQLQQQEYELAKQRVAERNKTKLVAAPQQTFIDKDGNQFDSVDVKWRN